jgi:hypothetical protein
MPPRRAFVNQYHHNLYANRYNLRHSKAETAALADSREEEGRRLRGVTAEAAMEMTAAIIIVFLYIVTSHNLILFQSPLELSMSVG